MTTNSERQVVHDAQTLEVLELLTQFRDERLMKLSMEHPPEGSVRACIEMQMILFQRAINIIDDKARDAAAPLSQVERMRPYLQHKSGCGQRYSSTAGEWVAGRDCTCGLTELLKDIK